MTLSPYWWPDSTKTDGLPYIRKDGERNPEVYEYPERENANRFGDAAYCLGVILLYHRKRSLCQSMRPSFADMVYRPETGHEPEYDLRTSRAGHEKNMRGSGFIDSRRFSRALGVAKLIEGSKSWTLSDKKNSMSGLPPSATGWRTARKGKENPMLPTIMACGTKPST